ncbi:Uncharacterized protein TCM_016709 [Theobroma cacao]|uniref:Uncharacterized protein n=1 Tax=Theobroma cacao TaxID=3641 RepID=A0A061G7J2_THECC|nr:Uncharacterized protein TCM_016709 [Theobroma cacao]
MILVEILSRQPYDVPVNCEYIYYIYRSSCFPNCGCPPMWAGSPLSSCVNPLGLNLEQQPKISQSMMDKRADLGISADKALFVSTITWYLAYKGSCIWLVGLRKSKGGEAPFQPCG